MSLRTKHVGPRSVGVVLLGALIFYEAVLGHDATVISSSFGLLGLLLFGPVMRTDK